MSLPIDPRDPNRPFVTRRDDLVHFPNASRRREENETRITTVRREQARDLLRRSLGREPNENEIDAAINR